MVHGRFAMVRFRVFRSSQRWSHFDTSLSRIYISILVGLRDHRYQVLGGAITLEAKMHINFPLLIVGISLCIVGWQMLAHENGRIDDSRSRRSKHRSGRIRQR